MDCFINENIFINADTTHLLPVLQRDIGCPCNKLAAPIYWRIRRIWITYSLKIWVYWMISQATLISPYVQKAAQNDSRINITIYSWKYDWVAWTLELKWAVSHVWCEKLKIVVVPIDPIINRETNVPFWIITNKVQSIYCWIWALHQADCFGISQVNLAVLESTLVDLVRIHPISNIQLVQIWVTMLVATNVPFVVQFISQPA